MSELNRRVDQRKDRFIRAGRSLSALALSSLMIVPLSGSETGSSWKIEYQEPSIQIVHDNGECPPNAQVGVINFAGAGQMLTGVYAAKATKDIISENYDECEAGIIYGTEYDTGKNTKLFKGFIDDNKFESVIVLANSFGGIAAVDTMNAYKEQFPKSNTRFVLALLSAPTGPENLQFLSWLGAQFHAHVEVPQDAVYGETFVGEWSQGKRWLNDKQLEQDVKNNAVQTPATLLSSQTKRLLKGMSKIDERLDVTLVYVGDKNDDVVDIDEAIQDVPTKTGRPLTGIFYMSYPDLMLQAHAGLWWLPYIQSNREPIEEVFKLAQNEMGFNAKAAIVNVSSGLAKKGINRPQ